MENKKRFFAFGCSMTKYAWPTWADIICDDFISRGKEAYNFANAGSGPMHTLYSVAYAKQKYNITEDDCVMIVWSSWTREDRIVGHKWSTWGNILNRNNDDPQTHILADIWTLELDVIKFVTAYQAVNDMVNVDFNGGFAVVENFDCISPDEDGTIDDMLFHKVVTTKLKNILPYRYPTDKTLWSRLAVEYDGHPSTNTHLDFVKQCVMIECPELKLMPQTERKVKEINRLVESHLLSYHDAGVLNARSFKDLMCNNLYGQINNIMWFDHPSLWKPIEDSACNMLDFFNDKLQ